MEPSSVAKKWSFNWDMFDVIVGGRSAIDLGRMPIQSLEDAHAFMVNYGFDPEKDAREIQSVMVEGICFIQKYLMPQEWERGIQPPDDILYCTDIRKILLFASSREESESTKQLWACALIRVMHTIAHIQGVYRLMDVEIAREQIMHRFEKYIFRTNDNRLFFGLEGDAIELERMEWKYEKARHSIAIKLLHKKANVAENIHDLLGVRMITKSLRDVLLVVKFLKNFHIITFPNANPSRARNTLLDVDQTKFELESLREELETGAITEEAFVKRLDTSIARIEPDELTNLNPHSSSNYQSIQLTCRQLIRYPEPIFGWSSKLRSILKFKNLPERSLRIVNELLQFSTNWGAGFQPLENTNFFPFEVHILDEATATANRLGDASHDRYKLSQIRTARRRVLAGILALHGHTP